MPAARSCSNQRQLPDSYGYLIHPLLKSERREQETRRSGTPGHSRTILFVHPLQRVEAKHLSHLGQLWLLLEAVQRVPPPLRYGKPWVSLQNWSEFSCCARFSGGTR